jgi:hypothetical protein
MLSFIWLRVEQQEGLFSVVFLERLERKLLFLAAPPPDNFISAEAIVKEDL